MYNRLNRTVYLHTYKDYFILHIHIIGMKNPQNKVLCHQNREDCLTHLYTVSDRSSSGLRSGDNTVHNIRSFSCLNHKNKLNCKTLLSIRGLFLIMQSVCVSRWSWWHGSHPLRWKTFQCGDMSSSELFHKMPVTV